MSSRGKKPKRRRPKKDEEEIDKGKEAKEEDD